MLSEELESEHRQIRLTIRSFSRSDFLVSIQISAKIEDLKDKISAETTVKPENQRLLYRAQRLKNENKISDYIRNDNGLVHMVIGANSASNTTNQAISNNDTQISTDTRNQNRQLEPRINSLFDIINRTNILDHQVRNNEAQSSNLDQNLSENNRQTTRIRRPVSQNIIDVMVPSSLFSTLISDGIVNELENNRSLVRSRPSAPLENLELNQVDDQVNFENPTNQRIRTNEMDPLVSDVDLMELATKTQQLFEYVMSSITLATPWIFTLQTHFTNISNGVVYDESQMRNIANLSNDVGNILIKIVENIRLCESSFRQLTNTRTITQIQHGSSPILPDNHSTESESSNGIFGSQFENHTRTNFFENLLSSMFPQTGSNDRLSNSNTNNSQLRNTSNNNQENSRNTQNNSNQNNHLN